MEPIKREFRDEKGDEWVAMFVGFQNGQARILFQFSFQSLSNPEARKEKNWEILIPSREAEDLMTMDVSKLQSYLSEAKRRQSRK